MGKFLGFLFLILLGIPAMIYNGFVFSHLWLWFIVPLGATAISVPHAMGLLLVPTLTLVGLYILVSNGKRSDEMEAIGELERSIINMVVSFLTVNFVFLYGYVIHSYM